MDKIRVAVVGCGMIADRAYLPGIARMEKADLVAVCDIVEERAKRQQARFDVPRSFASLDAMLDGEEFDLLVDLTDIPSHYGLNLLALQAGKHVYSEKTFAQTVDQATELIELAEAKGVKLGAAAATMLSPINRRAKSLIEEGAIGKVSFAKVLSSHGGPAYFPTWPVDPTWFYKQGSGPILDMGVYGLHTITGILGPAKRVTAVSGISDAVRFVRGGPFKGKRIDVEEDDLTVIVLDFGQATFAVVDASYCVRASRAPSLEIYGADGTIAADPMDWIGLGNPLSLWRDEVELGIRGWTDVELQDTRWELPMGVEHLIDCILEGRHPITSAEHARHVLEIMNTCLKAARTGMAQELTTTF